MKRALSSSMTAALLAACSGGSHAPPASATNARDGANRPNDAVAAAHDGTTGSPGCGRPAASGVRSERVSALGKARTYLLVVPKPYDPKTPYPVVFGLHGNGGSAAGVRRSLDLESHARGRAIFVYPEALGGGWDLDAETSKNRDVALFDAVLLALHQSLCVDERRVFVTGFSNGAYMANQLACKRGERIRAVATHSGGGPYENGGTYDDAGHLLCPGKAVAALVVHGLSDTSVLPGEGQKSIDHWSFANRCSGSSSPAPGAPSACVSRDGCVQPVVACKVPGLGHAMWSEGRRLTWSFFASFE